MGNLLQPDLGLVFWTVIIFLVVLFILRKYAWNPILNSLDERETSIAEALQQAEKAKEEMAKLTADNEKLLNEAKEERAKILKEAKEVGEKMITEAKDKAGVEYSKKVEDAKREIDLQKQAALAEVKNEVGTLAVAVAEQLLKKELNDKGAQEKYVAELVDDFKMN